MNPLKQLLELAQQREDAERGIRAQVAAARAEGHSWQAIANVIGGTKQAAQQRYSGDKAAERLLNDQVEQHRKEDRAKLAEYAAKREAEAGQLEGQTAIFIDAQVPATGTLECNQCPWSIYYPAAELDEALMDLDDHMHTHPDEPAAWSPAQAPAPRNDSELYQQLAGAHRKADEILAAEAAAKSGTVTTPHRYWDVTPLDVEDDLAPVESGVTDTAGYAIDWTQKLKDGRCAYCSMTHHYSGKGSTRYFWIFPQCNPTLRDDQFRPTGPQGQ